MYDYGKISTWSQKNPRGFFVLMKGGTGWVFAPSQKIMKVIADMISLCHEVSICIFIDELWYGG